jgi:MFS family permease
MMREYDRIALAGPGRHRVGLLAEREFRLLFLGRAVSFLGNAMAPIALAFAVIDLTGSPTDLGLVLAARTVPQVVFLLIGGVWADRLPRHKVMVVSSLASGMTQGLVAVLLLSGHAQIWHLAALGALNGASTAFFFPASAGIVPQTVPEPQIQQANALLRLALNSTSVVGAALGGAIVAGASPGWAIAVDAMTFALGAVFIGAMRLPGTLRLEIPSFLGELGQGWREFRSRTWLWVIVLQAGIGNAAFNGSLNVLGPVQADRHFGRFAWGVILASMAGGLIAGGLLMLRFRPNRMLLVAEFGVLLIVPMLALLAVPAPTAAIVAAAFATGFGLEIFAVLWDTTMQQQIPGEMLSRVYSYDALGSLALIPVGQAAIGPIADAVGTRSALFGAAAFVALAALPVFTVRDVRELRRK